MINRADIPMLFENKEGCCGCTACYAVCPVEAIRMSPDEEGFEYPEVNDEVCLRCGKCVFVCPCRKDIGTER